MVISALKSMRTEESYDVFWQKVLNLSEHNYVQEETFNQSIDKAILKTVSQLQDEVIEFLAKYQSTLLTITNSSPSELLNNTILQTILDLLHPCQTDTTKSKKTSGQKILFHYPTRDLQGSLRLIEQEATIFT